MYYFKKNGSLIQPSVLSQMYFEAGYKATILFEQWNTDSIGAMVGSCIGIFLLAIIYEGLKFFR